MKIKQIGKSLFLISLIFPQTLLCVGTKISSIHKKTVVKKGWYLSICDCHQMSVTNGIKFTFGAIYLCKDWIYLPKKRVFSCSSLRCCLYGNLMIPRSWISVTFEIHGPISMFPFFSSRSSLMNKSSEGNNSVSCLLFAWWFTWFIILLLEFSMLH